MLGPWVLKNDTVLFDLTFFNTQTMMKKAPLYLYFYGDYIKAILTKLVALAVSALVRCVVAVMYYSIE